MCPDFSSLACPCFQMPVLSVLRQLALTYASLAQPYRVPFSIGIALAQTCLGLELLVVFGDPSKVSTSPVPGSTTVLLPPSSPSLPSHLATLIYAQSCWSGCLGNFQLAISTLCTGPLIACFVLMVFTRLPQSCDVGGRASSTTTHDLISP